VGVLLKTKAWLKLLIFCFAFCPMILRAKNCGLKLLLNALTRQPTEIEFVEDIQRLEREFTQLIIQRTSGNLTLGTTVQDLNNQIRQKALEIQHILVRTSKSDSGLTYPATLIENPETSTDYKFLNPLSSTSLFNGFSIQIKSNKIVLPEDFPTHANYFCLMDYLGKIFLIPDDRKDVLSNLFGLFSFYGKIGLRDGVIQFVLPHPNMPLISSENFKHRLKGQGYSNQIPLITQSDIVHLNKDLDILNSQIAETARSVFISNKNAGNFARDDSFRYLVRLLENATKLHEQLSAFGKILKTTLVSTEITDANTKIFQILSPDDLSSKNIKRVIANKEGALVFVDGNQIVEDGKFLFFTDERKNVYFIEQPQVPYKLFGLFSSMGSVVVKNGKVETITYDKK
jgi:hypothetical protein